MLFSMLISLYTARVVLNALGASDFGLYNVIGGILSILAVLKVLVSSGTQRFLTYEMGKGASKEKLLTIFSSSLTVFFIIGAVIFILAETLGLWFLNTYIIIPEDRIFAANVVFQITIVSMFVSLVQVPYNSAILSHERMDIYGYIGIAEPLARLGLISLLPFLPGDNLITYSILLFFIFVGVTIFYVYFCRKYFEECRFRFSRDWATSKSLVSFTVWNLLETVSNSLSDQGQNILLNIYFGPIVNAARAVAFQVNSAVQAFASNFLIATFPQITKNYSAGNYESYNSLMFRGAKFAFVVLSLIFIPICLNTDYILEIWLKTPPEKSSLFIKLVIIGMMIRMVSEPLYTGIQATGNIKLYQICTNVVTLLNLPICYVLLKVWKEPTIVFCVTICLAFFIVGARIYFIKKLADFPALEFIKMIIFKCFLPFVLAYWPIHFINNLFQETMASFIGISIISVVWSCILFGLISINQNEREFIINIIRKKR